MEQPILDLLAQLHFRWQDLVDILLLSVIFYRLLTLIKGTRTIPMLIGFMILLFVYLFSLALELNATVLLLDKLANSLVLLLVVLFQSDIRNALTQFGLITWFQDSSKQKKQEVIGRVLQACKVMADKRIGALIVFERGLGLRDFTERGTEMNATVTKALLLSIFHTSSPLHDGAVVINRKGVLAAAQCILPISMSTRLPAMLGTRHRAAIGLTENTDAVVLIVSEERGTLSLSLDGEWVEDTEENLQLILLELLGGKTTEATAKDKQQTTTDIDPDSQTDSTAPAEPSLTADAKTSAPAHNS